MDYSYESDHTKFIRELLEKNPELQEKRKAARNMWWDRGLDKEEQKKFKESNDPKKPYAYYSE
ncbi:protein of unknown function [Nitrosomonas sp. PY1]|uniref:DUF3460 family protein n=1 Tax=Nitrosomonas sp. PY1 TaxID=1803906 RepID=UPI001FC8E37E|nr:DUF3460 family protein [Nitrosomonas sp. PY1]GKS68169.1 protein of unknown function [Nitrosomonas sp. PY1]